MRRMATTAHSFVVKDIKGVEKSFKDVAPGVALVVNTASACGFTPQYKGLEELYLKYKDKGFNVVAFPCNQFGAQEAKDEAAIDDFVCSRFKVTFPMMSKVSWTWHRYASDGCRAYTQAAVHVNGSAQGLRKVHHVISSFRVCPPPQVDVNGANAHPLWAWMKKEKPGLMGTECECAAHDAPRARAAQHGMCCLSGLPPLPSPPRRVRPSP